MNIHIHQQRRDSTTALDEQITSGVQRALGHLATRIDDVIVHLRVAHGSRGEMHTHCRILATVPLSQMVIVESLHPDKAEAITRASLQLARAVQEQFSEHDQPIATASVTPRIAATTLFRRRISVAALATEGQGKASQSHHVTP